MLKTSRERLDDYLEPDATFDDSDKQFRLDNDSIYVLPFREVPFENTALRRGRLSKNFALEPVVEIYRSDLGHGFFLLDDLVSGRVDSFKLSRKTTMGAGDLQLLRAFRDLDAFDVFSLRISLREIGIDLGNLDYLALSPDMRSRLRVYMREFTYPLLETVYGDGLAKELDPDRDIVDLFRNPSTDKAKANLERFAFRLKIRTDELADFLETFADVYLAISFYRHVTAQTSRSASHVFADLTRILADPALGSREHSIRICLKAQQSLRLLLFDIRQRLENYEAGTKVFWQEISPDRFREIQVLVHRTQMNVAGVLCGMGVKIARWQERFPSEKTGTSLARFEAVQTILQPGLDRLLQMIDHDGLRNRVSGEAKVQRIAV